MKRRLCRECGHEMLKELTPDGTRFFCETCEIYGLYDEFDMEPFCPDCGTKLQFCSKCSQGYFCTACGGLVSRKKIVWKPLQVL